MGRKLPIDVRSDDGKIYLTSAISALELKPSGTLVSTAKMPYRAGKLAEITSATRLESHSRGRGFESPQLHNEQNRTKGSPTSDWRAFYVFDSGRLRTFRFETTVNRHECLGTK